MKAAQAALPVPLALEPIAALLEWPNPALDEASFLAVAASASADALVMHRP